MLHLFLDPAGSSFPGDGAAVSTSMVLLEVEPSVVERAEIEPSVIEPVEVSPIELNSISSTSADSVTECSIAGGSTSSGWLVVLEAGFTAEAVLHVAVAIPASLTRFLLGSSMVSEPVLWLDIGTLTAYKDNFITGLKTAKVIFRRILQRQINNKFSMTTRIDLSHHSFISRGYRFFFRSTVYTGEYAYSELVPL